MSMKTGQEACLVLNIDTPRLSLTEDELMPVVVFLHGGSFDSMWSGMYRGHRFLKKDVVFVSMNYRLGVFGFLNLAIDDAPGNAALYDIISGLKWIKKYINFFGGKKSSITVIGMHEIKLQSDKKHKYIIMSCLWGLRENCLKSNDW